MSMPNDLIIDVAVNAAGFIAAGALMMLIFSALSRKNQQTALTSTVENKKAADSVIASEPAEPKGKIEFVNFQNNAKTATAPSAGQAVDSSVRFQRNRMEVIRQAKEMLNAGKGAADIKRTLPIAEAELNMIDQQRKNWRGRGAANDQ